MWNPQGIWRMWQMPCESRRVILKICMRACKIRRGLDEYGHFHAKPGGDGANMVISAENSARIGRIWSYSLKTRRGLGGYDQCHANPGKWLLKIVWMHAKLGGDWTNIVIFTENPPRIGRIWPFSPKTRWGLDEYGHIYRKPGEDWTDMAIFTENPAGIGRIWPYSLKTRRGLNEYDHIYRKPGGDGMNIATAIENSTRMR